MLTMKFGGTSVGDVERLREVVTIVKSFLHEQPVIVASAMSGVTNILLESAQYAVDRKNDAVQRNVQILREKHLAIADAFIKDEERRTKLVKLQQALIDDLANLYHGVALLKELSPRSLDAIASFGEILSCHQISAILEESGVPAQAIDARTVIRTDNRFGEAAVDFSVSNQLIYNALVPLVGKKIVPVVTGFIASTEDGLTTTLGRSGSDYTGSIIGAAVDSREIWIWTDVDGVMSADPRSIKHAAVLSEISYREAAEMSYFGAKVIHPKTMVPAIEKNIPIRIKNTFNPGAPGTLISKVTQSTASVVKTVTSIDRLSIISIEGNGMVGVPGISARIFSSLARMRVNVMMISQASSEHNVCIVVPQSDCDRAVKELRNEFVIDIAKKNIDDIGVQEPVSIVAVVGEGMKGTWGIAGKTFDAVAHAHVNIVAIAQGSSELNISFVVEQKEAIAAVQAVHDAFYH
jgi:bifunctional aspartokinase / homoserine dehydrogenase 1